MNVPHLESLEKLDRLFPTSLYKIRFHIFQNTSKFLMHELIPFKYRNICELCDNKQDKYKRGKTMVKKYFVLHEKAIDVYQYFLNIPTIEKLSFHLARVSIIGVIECGKNRNDSSRT